MAVFLTNPIAIIPISYIGSWQTINLSAYVPKGATGVILNKKNTNAGITVGGLRKTGSTDNRFKAGWNYAHSICQVIGCDNDQRQIDLYINPSDSYYLLGYFGTDATFLTNGIALSPVATFADVDLSSYLPVGSVAAIFEVSVDGTLYNPPSYDWGARCKGSTDNFTRYANWSFFICPVDVNRFVQLRCSSSIVNMHLVGYLTAGQFKVNSLDKSTAVLNSYVDVDLSTDSPPAGCSGVVADMPGPVPVAQYLGLRKNGYVGNFYQLYWSGTSPGSYCVPVDAGTVFEQYIGNTAEDLYISGYLRDTGVAPPSSDAVLEIDFYPYSLVIEWPYIYAVGVTVVGGIAQQIIVKYRIHADSIEVVESAVHTTAANAGYFNCCFGDFSSGYIFCCGYVFTGGVYKGVVRKVDKANLSSIAWSCLETGIGGSASSWSSVKEDSSGIVFTAGSKGGFPDYGWASRINASGVRTHIVSGVYSVQYAVIGFVNITGTDYVDITGSMGGYRFIYRYRKSDLYWNSGDLNTTYGAGATNNYYSWREGVVSSESGYDYYYVVGRNGTAAATPNQSLLKIKLSDWSLHYPNANVWESKIEKKLGSVIEEETAVVIDGTYVFTAGEFWDAGTNLIPIGPNAGSFRKINYSGVQQWAVNHLFTKRVAVYGLEQYGDYIIAGLVYNISVISPPIVVVGGIARGWIEVRNKSDGALATYPLTGFLTIGLSPITLTNSCGYGEDAPSQSFDVWNTSTGTLNYSISDDVVWLSCVPDSGVSTGEHDTITVNYSTSGLAHGIYNATITIDAPGASNAPQYIDVTLTVSESSIELSVSSLVNSGYAGIDATSQSFEIWNSAGGILNYSISDDAVWLLCWPDSGDSTGEHDTIHVDYFTAGLAPGTYTATITIDGIEADNTPQTIGVTLTIGPSMDLIMRHLKWFWNGVKQVFYLGWR